MVRTSLKLSVGSQVIRLALVVVLGMLATSASTCAQEPTGAPLAHLTVAYKPPATNDWANWKRDCHLMFTKPGKDDIISCATDTFRNRPFHFVAQTVVPGSGVGGGGYFGKDFNNNDQTRLELTGVLTIRQFSFAEAKFTKRRPHFGSGNFEGDFAWKLFARNKQMTALPFYGLGPNTNVHNSVQFSQRDTRIGITVANPFLSWLGVSGTFESLWPSVGGVTASKVISIQNVYTEQTAPGLATQPNFLHYQIFPYIHHLFADRFLLDYRFRYGYFQDTSNGHYSFRRLDLDFGHSFFPERDNGHRRLDSIFTTRFKISLSDKSAANAIPFYLHETIGGSDIDNEATLRAFKDFRFRAPNTFLVQAEYDRRIAGPVGLLVFYDAGKVAFAHSDINFNNMHQGFGGGLAFFMAGKVVFRAYVGLGGGEGAHPYFGIANFI
jgi:hypothetical protein